MGSAFRSYPGRPDPAACFRRPHLSSALSCRGPHRSGNDPHLARPWRAVGYRRLHGMHDQPLAQRWRSRCRSIRLLARTGPIRSVSSQVDCHATGGIGKAWKITSNSWEYTGDGMALAYDAGAELLDMEFVQFHPTGMVWPPGVQGILVTEAVRGEGGILRNKLGERFMERYDPQKMELSTRDVVARAIYTEVREGRGSEHGGAYLDISQKPAEFVKKKLPSMYHQFRELADV